MSNRPVFRFLDYTYDVDTGQVDLNYEFIDGPKFTETFTFNDAPPIVSTAQRNALDACLRQLHLAAGVSYYKAYAPATIELANGPLSPPEAAFFEKLYLLGLGEFAYRNGIDLVGQIQFPSSENIQPQPIDYALTKRALIPIGGGKDSIVSLEALKSQQPTPLLFYMGSAQPIRDCIAVSGLPSVQVMRRICPNLIRLNSEGALNGHVPVTGILSFLLAAAAVLYGCDSIVMSNERSANVGNLIQNGLEINHQYSKSFEFEQDFSAHIQNCVLPGLNYFSLLRPLSELAIAQRFTALTAYHGVFVSCNSAFKLDPSRRTRWCCNCPKCRFVFLALAPFIPRTQLIAIFGTDLLDDVSQTDGFSEILGLSGHKPFECVGEEAESRAAFGSLMNQADWQNTALVQGLGADLLNQYPDSATTLDAFLTPSAAHRVPADYLRRLSDLSAARVI